MWPLHTVECYSALKMKGTLTHATRMNLEDVMLGKISQSQKCKILYDSNYMRPQNSHIHKDKKQNGGWWLPGTCVGEKSEELLFSGNRDSVQKAKKVLELSGGDNCTTR